MMGPGLELVQLLCLLVGDDLGGGEVLDDGQRFVVFMMLVVEDT